MTRQEAIDFVKNSKENKFYYGENWMLKKDAILDIENIEDELWGDAEIFGESEIK